MVFEELVLHEMATLSNAKLAGCPSTLEPGEGYLCRLCSRRDAICKVMVMMQEIQTDHPFCYACLEKGNEMFSKALGGARSLSLSVSLSLSLCFSLSVSLSLTHTRAGGVPACSTCPWTRSTTVSAPYTVCEFYAYTS